METEGHARRAPSGCGAPGGQTGPRHSFFEWTMRVLGGVCRAGGLPRWRAPTGGAASEANALLRCWRERFALRAGAECLAPPDLHWVHAPRVEEVEGGSVPGKGALGVFARLRLPAEEEKVENPPRRVGGEKRWRPHQRKGGDPTRNVRRDACNAHQADSRTFCILIF